MEKPIEYSKNLNILANEKVKNEDIPILENKIPEIDKYCGIFALHCWSFSAMQQSESDICI